MKKFREDAEKEKQEGIQGRSESPAREHLEQVQCWKDTACTPRMTKQAFLVLKGGDWEEYKKVSSVSKPKPRNGPLTEYRKLSRRWRKMRQES